MGAQIGAEYAIGGHEVVLITRSAASGEGAMQRARSAIRALVSQGLLAEDRGAAAEPRLSTATDISAACAARDVIVESVGEDMNAKADVLDSAARAAPDALLCSNTSSIPITRLGEAARPSDLAVRRALGRRWSLVGPFETMALGGRETFVRIAKMLFAELGQPVDPELLERIPLPPAESLRSLAHERDRKLVDLRKRDLEGPA